MSKWARSVLFGLSVFIAAPAIAQQPPPVLTGVLKKINDSGVLAVGYAEAPMPFSYYDPSRNIIGYSIDICRKVIDAVKADLKKPDLKVEMRAIKPEDATSYIASGVVDIHCGPIPNNWARKGQVDFGMTYFVRRYRFASHESAHMNELPDMEGRTFVTTNGAAMTALRAFGASRNFQLTIVPARNNEEAFKIFRDGGAQAVVLDEISLAQGVAKSPLTDMSLVTMGDGAFAAEPYSLIFVKGDGAFKRLIGDTMQKLYTSGSIEPIYAKWFTSPVPPEGISLNLPVSEPLRKAFQRPTDSPDPALYE